MDFNIILWLFLGCVSAYFFEHNETGYNKFFISVILIICGAGSLAVLWISKVLEFMVVNKIGS